MDFDSFEETVSSIKEEHGHTNSNVWFHDYDFDQTSGYPSDSAASNLSKMTTKKEVKSIGNIEKETFKRQNINTLFGPINSIDYCTTMMNAPDPDDILDYCIGISNS
jgi:hypothetical protein